MVGGGGESGLSCASALLGMLPCACAVRVWSACGFPSSKHSVIRRELHVEKAKALHTEE